jgi:hypothetical protein
LVTSARAPSGVTAIPLGASPTGIVAPAVRAATSIGVTVSAPVLATYAVLPSGVMAIAPGASPTPIAAPAVFVARRTTHGARVGVASLEGP